MGDQVAALSPIRPEGPRKPWRAMHRDFAVVDEVSIKLQERWKESELSGDEWRFSARIEFKRKGRVLRELSFGSMEFAINHLGYHLAMAGENGELAVTDHDHALCDQPGCAKPPTITYRLKKRYCNEGHASDPHSPMIRRFCERHKHLGDCGLDDGDHNYEPVTLNPDGTLPDIA